MSQVQKYTESFKVGFVNRVLEQGMTQYEVAKWLGTPSKNVSRRVVASKKAAETLSESSVKQLQIENQDLLKEHQCLPMEREILKKVMVFFVNEPH